MRALIIDNETPIRESVVELIKAFCPEITEIAEEDSVKSGIARLKNSSPDILFLDVELGDGTGMDVLSEFAEIEFPVIFITAHNKYAIDAFKHSAIDFLLKPIDPELLMNAVKKASEKREGLQIKKQLSVLENHLKQLNGTDKKIVLKDSESIYFVKVDEIIHCESEGSYTTFNLTTGEKIVISKTIKEYEELLEQYGFIRTHQSHLVNISKIKRFDKNDGGFLILENNISAPVSQRKKDFVLNLLQNL